MVAITENSTAESTKKKKKQRINYALAATLLATGCEPEAIAGQVGAKNWNSVRVGLAKRGVTQNATKALPPSEIVVQRAAVNIATSAVEEIRERLTKELMHQVGALESKPVSYAKLASKGQGRAAVVKTIAESFKSLHGGAEMNVLVFGVDSMNDRPGSQPTIELEPTPQRKQNENTATQTANP